MSYLMKPNLILLPGLLNDARLWQAQAERLASVANVSVADLTGSDTIAELAADVLEQVPAGMFALAGLSMGGCGAGGHATSAGKSHGAGIAGYQRAAGYTGSD